MILPTNEKSIYIVDTLRIDDLRIDDQLSMLRSSIYRVTRNQIVSRGNHWIMVRGKGKHKSVVLDLD